MQDEDDRLSKRKWLPFVFSAAVSDKHLHSYSEAIRPTGGGRRCRAFADARDLPVARFLEKVLEIAETAPKRASVSLSRILAPITLVPVKNPDGTRRYEARGALNTNPAALSDGRVSVDGSCGGAIVTFSEGFVART
jgi:hypothetical protein